MRSRATVLPSTTAAPTRATARRHTPPPVARDSARKAADKAPQEIDYGPLEHWIGFHLRMAQAAAFRAFARLSEDGGLRPGWFATLTLIDRNPGIGQTALSRAYGRDKSTLTPLLGDLVRHGLGAPRPHRARPARVQADADPSGDGDARRAHRLRASA